ncbi:MAG TPA: glycoside hydrolase family 9 protein [Streptosporangiaceae bacterium]|nr:glycoside hydrolase family 9 protein [Streptosporangiaceae bacterium]
MRTFVKSNRRAWPAIAIGAVATAVMLVQPTVASAVQDRSSVSAAIGAETDEVSAQVRVNQVGYATYGTKVAYVMLPKKVASVRFEVVTPFDVAYRGSSADDVGGWNANYRAVYKLSFSGLTMPGQYRVKLLSPAVAASPGFTVGDGAQLYGGLVGNAVRYFTSERDGQDVVSSVMSRRPANLTDAKAFVYADPRYDGNDNLLGTLKKTGGPVDVSGGWFDAGGGYEKFGYTESYADALMLLAARDYPGSSSTLGPEAAFGLQWITKLWKPARKVLYAQVGIGTGNASNTIQGDYNFWFLPQAEDRLKVGPGQNPGPSAYYVKYRPVFPAAPADQKVSPNLAGRYAADFALGAQVAAGSDAASAAHLLSLARSVYAMARTTGVGQLVTAFPHDFYPATQWKSDMLWGAAEIALADEAAGAQAGQVRADLAAAARWARAYIAQGHSDTFNLYDTGAVAEAELIQAMRQAGDFPVAPATLLGDLAAQLRSGQAQAKGDPFALGTQLGDNDASPHAFGLYITDALYHKYGGTSRFASFAQQQLNFALGANAWGTSFVVGAGTVFPHCMQSEIANLSGSLTGRGDIQLGAVTDGPSATGNFQGLGTVDGMRACSAGHFAPFNTKTAAYEDNVVSWPSVEPAADYTANSLLAFALGADQGSGLG